MRVICAPFLVRRSCVNDNYFLVNQIKYKDYEVNTNLKLNSKFFQKCIKIVFSKLSYVIKYVDHLLFINTLLMLCLKIVTICSSTDIKKKKTKQNKTIFIILRDVAIIEIFSQARTVLSVEPFRKLCGPVRRSGCLNFLKYMTFYYSNVCIL